jgi:hypothetical protein
VRTFRISVLGGFVTRLGIGGVPFLLPLLFQIGLGYGPLMAGLLTMPLAVAAIGMAGGADLLTLGKCVTGECEIDVEIAKGLCLACVALSQYIVPGSELYEEPPPPDPKGKKK